ncbi:hypothetical protein LXA43DRAFT_1059672 [Ganoderma leucocontextum]|nr:hypothetical protein LXA43DRAFT_1059672 [Ganoderma leucocontextum]
MTPCEEAPLHPPLSPYVSASPSMVPHILRECISQELADLDAEEKALIDSISRKRLELKRLWNSSLPIQKLPNELLVQIFAHLQEVVRRPGKHAFWPPNVQRVRFRLARWQGLMLVCRHWRDILMSSTMFWRMVSLDQHINWTKLCLDRSAAAPLDVYARHHDRCPLDVLYPHIHRFQAFSYEVASGSQSRTAFPPLFGRDMPLLESLNISVLERTPYDNMDAGLTSKRFPRLHTMMLSRTMAPQDASLYAQLRMLSLSRCPHILPFDDFLDALAASVQLEELALTATVHRLSGEWAHRGPVPRRPPISLPRLRIIALSGHGIVHTSRFLAHLQLHPSVSLRISGDVEDSQADDDHDFPVATSISAMLPPNHSTTLPALAITTEVRMTMVADYYSMACANPSRADAAKEHAILSLSIIDDSDWTRPVMMQGLEDLVEGLGRSPLTSLTVDGNHDYGTIDAWERVFRTFPLLQELEIGEKRDVTNVFLGLHAASTPFPDGAVACPHLRRIVVDGLSLAATYAALRECFVYRSDRGVVLEVLDLECLFHGEDMTSEARYAFIEDLGRVVECVRVKVKSSESDEEQQESDGEAA